MVAARQTFYLKSMERQFSGFHVIDMALPGALTEEQQAAVQRLREGLERLEKLERKLWWRKKRQTAGRICLKVLRVATLPLTFWLEQMLRDSFATVADLPMDVIRERRIDNDAVTMLGVELQMDLGLVVDIVHGAMKRQDMALVAVLRRELVERRRLWYVDELVEEIDAWVLEQSRRAALFQEAEPIVINLNTQGAGGESGVYFVNGTNVVNGMNAVNAAPTDEQIRRAIRAALQVTGAANSVKWVGVWMAWQQDQRLQRVTEYRDFIALMQEDRFRQPDLPPCTETFLKVYNGDAYLLRTAVAEWNADEWRRRGKSSNTKSSQRHIAVMQRAAEAFQRSLQR